MTTSLYSYHQLRRTSFYRWRRLSWTVSLLAHGGVFFGLFGIPALLSPERPPIEYVNIQVVPLQALGQPDAPIVPDAKPQKKKPEPVPVEPAPEPETPPARTEPERPVLSEPKAPSAKSPKAESRGESAPPPPAPIAATRGSEKGSASSNLAFGATEVTGLDNPDFVYGYYLNQMLGMIHSEWNRPQLDSGVEAIVAFRVARDGSISELRVSESSGFSQYDLAALRAIQNAAPFPPLPQAYRHDSLGVNLRVQ